MSAVALIKEVVNLVSGAGGESGSAGQIIVLKWTKKIEI